MKRYLLLVLLVCCFMFSLTGCTEKKLIGKWELAAVEYDGEEMDIEDFAKDLFGREYYEYVLEYAEDYFDVTFKENGKGKIGDASFKWTLDGKEVTIKWKDEYLKSYIGKVKGTVKGKDLRVELDSDLFEYFDLYDVDDVVLIFRKK